MRNQYSMIWTSSYDRDLEALLDMWPEIKKQVPKAELTITYGWELFIAAHQTMQFNPERMAWRETMIKKMQQPGITHLGRVGQTQMVTLLRTHAIWAYPTNFDEISCISAMKAQVYGAIPVTTNHAALKETVKYGSKVEGDINDPKVRSQYIKELVSWLTNKDRQLTTRKEMMEWAKGEYSWADVAKVWIEDFKKPKTGSEEWAKEFIKTLPIKKNVKV